MPSTEKRKAISSSLPVWERKKRKWNYSSSLNIYDDDQIREEEEEEEQRCSESTTMSSSNVLPYDIIINEILLRIPAKYLLRFRLVSKYWFHCITDPKFVKMHLNFQAMNKPPLLMMRTCFLRPLCHVRLDDDDKDKNGGDLLQQLQQQQQHQQQRQQKSKSLRFWGSSNGLVCVQLIGTRECKIGNHNVCLWNPCTKEFKQLPYRCMKFPSDRSGSITESFGFGYTNDYKVIRNLGYYYDNFQFLHTLVEVYKLGTDSWKVIGKYPYEVVHHIGVYVGGGVYWLATRQSIDMIICFDIANEDYKEISWPPSVLIKTENSRECHLHISSKELKLTELKGFLCIINPIVEQKCMEVWAMNKEEEESNWSKLFTIREPINAFPYQILSSINLLGNVKNNSGDEILMLVDSSELLLYNPKNDRTRALIQIDEADAENFKEVQTCIDSLVSLNSDTYEIL